MDIKIEEKGHRFKMMFTRLSITIMISYFFAVIIGCRTYSDKSELTHEAQVNRLVKNKQIETLDPLIKPQSADLFTDIIVFGDSLSDTGQLRANTWNYVLPPEIYWQGRFSNGPVWIDYVGSSLQTKVHNFAVGGAETREKSFPYSLVIPSLNSQIADHLDTIEEFNPDKTIYVIWIGANNYLFDNNSSPKTVIKDIETAIQQLIDNGIKHLAVGTMPTLKGLPTDPKVPRLLSDEQFEAYTIEHNTRLIAMLKRLKEEQVNQSINIFHGYDINQQTIDRKLDFGFTDLKNPCYRGDLYGKFHDKKEFCKNYFTQKFWDFSHPNSKMHCYYAAQFIFDLLTEKGIDQSKLEDYVNKCRSLTPITTASAAEALKQQ
ncbi:MAG: hypothetical protein CMP10_14405 [Zetaproteobacteria bacterium]|nr:hypothetical protein [Pseudobdellovibrionaceae bacterium]|tara:strand:+ start:1520 stop:2644 length:1125 start_codon:yes stop_codon:yes gene_type:complete